MQKKSMKNFQGYKIWEKAATYHRAWPITFPLVIFLIISQQAQTSIEVGSLKSYLFELHGKPYDK